MKKKFNFLMFSKGLKNEAKHEERHRLGFNRIEYVAFQ